jgi:site-specific recombinase XerD
LTPCLVCPDTAPAPATSGQTGAVTGRVYKRKYEDRYGQIRECSTYTIRYSDGHGHTYEEPSKTTRIEDANALLRKKEQAVWDGSFFPERRNARKALTFADLYTMWTTDKASKRSLRDDKARLGAARDHFGPARLVSTLTPDDVHAWKRYLHGQTMPHLSTATVNRHLAVLRSALNHAAANGYRHQDPMRGFKLDKERNERNRLITDDEYARLRTGATTAGRPDLVLLTTIGRRLGMRLGEIVTIGSTAGRLDVAAGVVRLMADETKEGEIKSVPLHSDVRAALASMDKGKAYFGHTSQTYSRHFAELCTRLGIDDLHFHDLRHAAETDMLDAGLDVFTVQAITGHKTLGMTKRYRHVTDRTLRAAMAKLEAHTAAEAAATEGEPPTA